MYQLTQDGTTVRRLIDGAFIPADPRNADRREYLRWVAAGGAPDPAPPPPLPPRDLAAEIDALKANVARAKAIEDAAVKKGVLTRAEVDAEVKPVSAEVVRG